MVCTPFLGSFPNPVHERLFGGFHLIKPARYGYCQPEKPRRAWVADAPLGGALGALSGPSAGAPGFAGCARQASTRPLRGELRINRNQKPEGNRSRISARNG